MGAGFVVAPLPGDRYLAAIGARLLLPGTCPHGRSRRFFSEIGKYYSFFVFDEKKMNFSFGY
jgi:hypothetical protein